MSYFNDLVHWLFALSRVEFIIVIGLVILFGAFCMRGMGLKQN